MGNSSLNQKRQIAQSQKDQLLVQQTQLILKNFERLNLNQQKAFMICNMSVSQLVNQINQGRLSSQQLLTALSYRTVTLAKQLNLFTYLYYKQSLKSALECDQYRKQSKKKNITLKQMCELSQQQQQQFLPALYGIPISVKDVFHLQGKLATIGLVTNANKEHQQSELVQCFRNAGMIPFVQTNVPQFGMAMETGNYLWGRAKNPWNTDRAVGGSSGGEGGMISARCSVLGVGSDIGGSIRIPSEHCGVFGLKPNSKRISNSYHASLSKSFQSFAKTIPNCLGPLARSSQDLALFMSITTTPKYYSNPDPYIPIIPFNPHQYINFKIKQKYRIGYIKSLKDIEPSQASQRALSQVLQLLRKQQNIELIEIEIPNQRQVIREFIREYLSCKGGNYKEMLDGEAYVKQYRSIFMMARLRLLGRFVIGNVAKLFMPRTYFYFFGKKPTLTVMDYQTHVGEISEFRTKWIEYWRQNKLDFVIAPGFGCQAFPHEQSEKLGLAAAYTYIWNVLDMAVGAMPVTRVRYDQQQYTSQFRDILTYDLKSVARNSKGLPVGIQIIGLPYHQQRVLALMNYLEQQIRFYEREGTPNIKFKNQQNN